MFLELLDEAAERHGVLCHAYCLLGNHHHLVLEAVEGQLSEPMHHLFGCYTTRFNLSMGFDGPLWKSRFQSRLVTSEKHFMKLSRYVHRNALDVDRDTHPERYRWSSLGIFSGRRQEPPWLSSSYTLGLFGGSVAEYLKYIVTPQPQDKRRWEGRDFLEVLETEDFLSDLGSGVAAVFGVDEIPPNRPGVRNDPHACFVLIGVDILGAQVLAQHLSSHRAFSLKSTANRMRRRVDTDADFAAQVAAVRSRLHLPSDWAAA